MVPNLFARPLRQWIPGFACLVLISCMANPDYVDRVDTLKLTRLPYEAQPETVAPAVRQAGSTEVIYLHSKEAKVFGPKMPTQAKYEHRPDGSRDNIGFWLNPAEYVTWPFTPKESGSFLVVASIACPRESAGSDYSLEVAGQTFVRTVPDTGGWDKFVPFQLGVVDLDGGKPYTVVVRFKEKRSGALMNLQAVTLRGGEWPPGLAAWWRFDEGSGDATADALTELTDTVQFARWTWGMSGTALRLNGFSSRVERAAASVPGFSTGLTVEAWVKVLSKPEGWCPIVNQHSFPTGFYFGFDGSGALGLHLSVGGAWRSCISAVAPPIGEWAHVAATFDATSGAHIYINGQETGRLYASGKMTQAEAVDLVIGRNNNHPWSLDALVDEMRIFRRALSEQEVRSDYRSMPAPLSPPPIVLEAVCADRDTASIYERVTLEVGLLATYDNPFDSDDVRVDAAVVSPSGRKWTVPGFLYQPFDTGLAPDAVDPKIIKQVLTPAGQPRWQVRLSFDEVGAHRVIVSAADRTGTVTSDPLNITVEDADLPGPIRRHGMDPRYFVTARGETFFPVGANVCWAGPKGTLDYDRWLPLYAENGCNIFRVWLSPQWPTCAMNTVESGFDRIDLGNAWRFDHVLEVAEELGLRVMPCIDSFNILRAVERSPGNMEDAPYVRERGGPVVKPLDYFTHPASLKAYRDRLRYLVARYGYSPSIFAWEFWNEVDIIDGYDSATVTAWHQAMCQELRDLDPWQHLITTSHADPKGDPAVDALRGLDFVQTHAYNVRDVAREFDDHRKQKAAAKDRPHLHGEFGIGHDGKKTAEDDPTGVHLHNALFSCVGQEQAGAPMTWWWDSYVDARKLYPLYGSFAAWVDGFDFVAQNARHSSVKLVTEDAHLEEPTDLEPIRGTWDPADFNRPLTVKVDKAGIMTMPVPLSSVLHGTGFHKDLHNPVTFELDVPEKTTFGVDVDGYSGHGNGHLKLFLDNKVVVEKDFPVPKDNKEDTLHLDAGTYGIELPAGRHVVKVENTGQDWIGVKTYRIPWLKTVRAGTSPLRVYGLTGDTMALLWVQSKLYTWPAATAKGFQPSIARGVRLDVSGLARGTWTVERFDIAAGKVAETTKQEVGGDGRLSIPLPDIAWDAAYRLRLEPNER